MTTPLLPLRNLADRHPGLMPEIAAYYLQAAAVCLDRHHSPPLAFNLRDERTRHLALVAWEAPQERERRAWANHTDATEDGAYACALAAIELLRGLVAVSRAETMTGADYYLAPVGKVTEDLEECWRLEVSGTDRDASEVKTRLRRKIQQALRGRSNLPALAVVVGFKARLIAVQAAQESA